MRGRRNHFIECETLPGFHTSGAGVTPAPSVNRKMARTPFCSNVLFQCHSSVCSPFPAGKGGEGDRTGGIVAPNPIPLPAREGVRVRFFARARLRFLPQV